MWRTETVIVLDPAPAELSTERHMSWIRTVSSLPLVQTFVRFLGVGVVGLAVDASVFTALDLAHVAPEWSRAISLALATLATWWLNRRHTFGASGRRMHLEFLRYVGVTLISQGSSFGVFLARVYEAPALPRLFGLLAGAVLGAVIGFAGHKLFAFSPRPSRRLA